MPPRCSIDSCATRFQSAPDREAGRCAVAARRVAIRELFQSAPDREAGRCLATERNVSASTQFQSAPDREAGRCERPGDRARRHGGFNPRPTVRPGDASMALCALPPILQVSIRARP